MANDPNISTDTSFNYARNRICAIAPNAGWKWNEVFWPDGNVHRCDLKKIEPLRTNLNEISLIPCASFSRNCTQNCIYFYTEPRLYRHHNITLWRRAKFWNEPLQLCDLLTKVYLSENELFWKPCMWENGDFTIKSSSPIESVGNLRDNLISLNIFHSTGCKIPICTLCINVPPTGNITELILWKIIRHLSISNHIRIASLIHQTYLREYFIRCYNKELPSSIIWTIIIDHLFISSHHS